jgi:cyclophilin family peptidyl-prolyl cis-trans isomerase
MKKFSRVIPLLLVLHQCAYAAKVLPVLLNPIDDLARYTNDSTELIALNTAFTTKAIDDQVVRFTSQASNGSRTLDFALFSDATPATRTNFLQYVTDGDYVNSIIHRSAPGFVIQGGGFYDADPSSDYSLASVPTDAPIVNEFSISNTYGTVSMAKMGGDPDSATSQWFVSIGANSDNLDNQNGGFTVFARITKSTLSNAASFGNPSEFPIWNAGNPYSALPLNATFDNSSFLAETDFILFTSVALVAIGAGDAGESTALTYSVVSNSDPSIVTPTITAVSQLQLSYTGNTAGSSTLTIRTTDSVGNTVDDEFIVSVALRTYDSWRQSQFSGGELTNDAISGPTVDSNDDGLTNLELYLHNLNSTDTHADPVEFSNTELTAEPYATFTFPIRNDLADITFSLEESTDLGQLDPWDPIPYTEISRITNGSTDTVKIRSSATNASTSHFYRLKFTLAQ